MIRLILLLLFLFPLPAFAAGLDYNHFKKLPVQHEGRIKPADTFARAMLDKFSGRESLAGLKADAWLAEMLFDPAQALRRPVFRIFRPSLLGLPEREGSYYSYAELAPALQSRQDVIAGLLKKEDDAITEDQREILRLVDAAGFYTQLLRSFSMVLPLDIPVPPALLAKWDLPESTPFTLELYRRHRQSLDAQVQEIIRKKGGDPAQYSEEEQKIAQFAMDMEILEQGGQNNNLFRIFPAVWGAGDGEWLSPWMIAESGQGSPENAAYLKLWQDMALAYHHGDAALWTAASLAALDASYAFAPHTPLQLETVYNAMKPLTLASFLYLIAFFGVVAASLRPSDRARKAALMLFWGGALLHMVAILSRVTLLSRPPVGTLYESVIFVALVCVLISAFIEMRKKDGQGLLVGTISGLILLFIGQSFAAEDTMQMLVAVLNTNFWLSTHVLCITMGYGWCIIASFLAHIRLFNGAFGAKDSDIMPAIKTTSLIALLFTAVGTLLGGIWADQSWGRFWGWDPKENGALLIVLWLIWAVHGQISGHLKRLPYTIAIAALSAIIAIAWFGVNLLNVGLHSYGFITGVATSLFAFVAVEALILGFLFYKIRTREAA